jgi:hypothetical protein
VWWFVAIGCSLPATPEEVAQKLAGIQPGEEREMGDGAFMLIHRLQATAPIDDRWHLGTSTEGGFTVELPLPFNDFRQRMTTTDGVEMRSHSVGAKSPGLLAWTATCMIRRDGKLGPDDPPPGKDEITVLGSPPAAHQRSVQLADRVCILIVEAQGSDPLPPEADRLRFLQSLTVTGEGQW